MSSQPPRPSVTGAPESPTTARPLEMDDDDFQESGVFDNTQSTATVASSDTVSADAVGAAPPKPPRPASDQQQKLQMLKEAFPTVEEAVIKAVLTASRGQIEPAFNALLQMTDPDAAKNDDSEQPPPHPPRPSQQQLPLSSTPMSQLEADELYARQLAEHYENVGAYEARTANRTTTQGYNQRHHHEMRSQNQDYDREHNFFDDELPVIKENLRKGFLETQNKFNEWFTTVKKRIDGDMDDPDYHDDGPRPGHGRVGRRPGELSRRSNDYDRYDADPQLLTDDFAGMKFHSDGTPARNQKPMMGNPDVFRPPPKSTSPAPRKVAFKEHVEDIDDLYESGAPQPVPKDATSPGKPSKWQPLSAVEPNPIGENDPFSLGDSEDEKEPKDKVSGNGKPDQEDLQKATAEAMAENLVESNSKTKDASKKA